MTKRLFDAMLTPQAAPESAALRRMRLVWVALCASLFVGIAAIRFVVGMFGEWGALGVFVLTVATPVHGLIYFRRKNALDLAYAARDEQ